MSKRKEEDNFNQKFMEIAIKEALRGLKLDHGGPFGAVIVKDGKVIAKAHNTVIKTNDPTAHAEINAIRKASRKLKRFDLSDCVLYTTSFPCPMCLSATMWAKIKTIYYSCDLKEAKNAGFDDEFIYNTIQNLNFNYVKRPKHNKKERDNKTKNKLNIIKIELNKCKKPFVEWKRKENKIIY